MFSSISQLLRVRGELYGFCNVAWYYLGQPQLFDFASACETAAGRVVRSYRNASAKPLRGCRKGTTLFTKLGALLGLYNCG